MQLRKQAKGGSAQYRKQAKGGCASEAGAESELCSDRVRPGSERCADKVPQYVDKSLQGKLSNSSSDGAGGTDGGGHDGATSALGFVDPQV